MSRGRAETNEDQWTAAKFSIKPTFSEKALCRQATQSVSPHEASAAGLCLLTTVLTTVAVLSQLTENERIKTDTVSLMCSKIDVSINKSISRRFSFFLLWCLLLSSLFWIVQRRLCPCGEKAPRAFVLSQRAAHSELSCCTMLHLHVQMKEGRGSAPYSSALAPRISHWIVNLPL